MYLSVFYYAEFLNQPMLYASEALVCSVSTTDECFSFLEQSAQSPLNIDAGHSDRFPSVELTSVNIVALCT